MTATDTYLLLRAFCDELARSGMEHACTSPGSRNTPIVMSLVGNSRIRCWSHIDERCAGFFALGAAKTSGRPVAVTCTSGTAAANLMPAVIEAHWARVPLLVLTADRPPELRDVGAGQTVDQLKLYGDAVKWFFEAGTHDATPERLRWIRTLACRAYWTALQGRPGPVHLNFALREPLTIDQPLPDDDTARGQGQPYVVVEPSSVPTAAQGPGPHPSGRLLLVAGTGTQDPARIAEFAARAGVPVLADPLSGARRGAAAIAHYDLLLRDPGFAAEHRPEFVFRVGDLPTSKPLRAWLASLADIAQIVVDPHGDWQDPEAVVGMRIHSALPTPERVAVEPGWLDAWTEADARVANAIDAELGEDELSEPLVARGLLGSLDADALVFIASSMPVRDTETFLPARDQPPRMLANRGANGIDGTVSSAFGAAAATGRPVVLLIGDVALAHDLGGLLAARRLKLDLTIVLLNNDGGGIFDFLPVARLGEAFEEHVATPHALEFAKAAALYGCAYERPVNLADLRDAVRRSTGSRGTCLIEVRTDRRRNLELHRTLTEAATAALTDSR
jgi:2-succinyl-5-enolpyruvyl-6-hydroxy-3-cyclohexene-1-carboxylate synthase